MEQTFQGFLISDDKEKLQLDRIYQLLGGTYWAKDRPRERILKSIANSLCFGIYAEEKQVGFCRCVTDYATVYWLADVIVDPEYRTLGLGKSLVDAVIHHELLQGCFGILATQDAHGLYEQYGFQRQPERFMRRPAK
jgi:GNAT superfamily N-acetyltransferase